MWGRVKSVVLAAVVATAALVPLFGDPRQTPVTHPLWARMLLRSLEMTEAVRASSQASQVFSALAPRDEPGLFRGSFPRAEGAALSGEGTGSVLTAGATPAEVSFAIPIAQPGDYHLRARLSGAPAQPCTAEVRSLSGGEPLKTFTLVPANETSWISAGTAHLDPGAYAAQFLLPPGASLSQVEVAPPCVNPIEPAGGWQAEGVTTADDLAVTALKAIDIESELPPAAHRSSSPATASRSRRRRAPSGALCRHGARKMTLKAGRAGVRALVSFEVPEPGLYAIAAFATPGGGQRYRGGRLSQGRRLPQRDERAGARS